MHNSETVQVVCAIIERNGKFLAAQRNKGQANEWLWEFPGGKIKKGENPGDALIREIKEELGVTIIISNVLTPIKHAYPALTIELIPYLCSISDGNEPQALEHAQIKWIDSHESDLLHWAPADIPILEEYRITLTTKYYCS